MSKPVIEVSGISKSYILSHQQKASYGSLKDSLVSFAERPFLKRNEHVSSHMAEEKFLALNDVSFSVNKGEVFGIVGRNGSGKSTLLKILSRIVDPSSGKVVINGRTASLLEVGTGFHPELTGRENIFFNGSMLGMSRDEIGKKFDEIVEFAEIEKFLDTPVKFYSSGMYVRLAFSVAAHLEPDILILDEVLAVGDAVFQQKSLRKIMSTMEEGRTVLFVSHGMDSVRQLCSRGILLKDGQVAFSGGVEALIDEYNKMVADDTPEVALHHSWENDGSFNDEYFVPTAMYITDQDGNKINQAVKNDVDHFLNIEVEIKKDSDLFTIGYSVHNEHNSTIYVSAHTDAPANLVPKLKVGKHTLRCKIPKHLLNAGTYRISLFGGIHKKLWVIEPESSTISIHHKIDGGLSDSLIWTNPRSGYVAPVLEWQIIN